MVRVMLKNSFGFATDSSRIPEDSPMIVRIPYGFAPHSPGWYEVSLALLVDLQKIDLGLSDGYIVLSKMPHGWIPE